VLLNVLENSRLAHARRVDVHVAIEPARRTVPTRARRDGPVGVITVDDDARHRPRRPPRIFEPHFSTRTSGSGLGLALSRRIVDGGDAVTIGPVPESRLY